MRLVAERVNAKVRGRLSYLRRAKKPRLSPYVDSSPAGDPTYDPHGTRRPFCPTHKVRSIDTPNYSRTYRDMQQPGISLQSNLSKIAEAMRYNITYRFNGGNPLDKVRPAGLAMAAVVGAVCLLVIGTSALSAMFPLHRERGIDVTTDYAAATSEAQENGEPSASTQISPPKTTVTTEAATTSSATPDLLGSPGLPLVDSISANTMQLYVNAADSCGMPWQILAAIGRVETNHGLSTAAGVADGSNYAGAKGPMQFMQSTWDVYGLDANHDGTADIYNQTDAVYSAASYLCANGANTDTNIDNAIWHYNHSTAYVDLVHQTAAQYYDNSYRAPLPPDSVSSATVTEPHHNYAATDLPVPAGTPVFAVHKGAVHIVNNDACGTGIQLDGTDGVRYTYCHAAKIDVTENTIVNAGTTILHSGGSLNSGDKQSSAESSEISEPHLHFEITFNDQNLCPQPVLAKWMTNVYASPIGGPTTDCIS